MQVVILHNAVSANDSIADQDVLVQVDAVSAALQSLGHGQVTLACTADVTSVIRQVKSLRPDVVFNLVETLEGSDRFAHKAAAVLEYEDIPYTGAPAAALFLTNRKVLAKELLCHAGLPTPEWIGPKGSLLGHAVVSSSAGVFRPGVAYVLKTLWEHASVHLDDHSVVTVADEAELQSRLAEAASCCGRPCFAERFIDGREINVALLDGPSGPQVLPASEIHFVDFPPDKPRIVGYRAKWEEGSFEYENTPRRFDFPPQDRPLLDRLAELSLACWRLFGLRGYARVDFRVDASGQPWILEVNANPCLSPDGGFHGALQQAGIPYPQAVARILDAAQLPCIAPWRQPPTVPADVASASPCAAGPAAPGPYTFRYEVRPEDPDLVRAIVESAGLFNPAEVGIAIELVEERLAKGPASGYRFVFAERDGQTLGYACYGPIPGTQASYDLYWIAVRADHQRQGLGRRLLGESERLIRAAGGRRVYVETSSRDQYAPTRAFYQRCGYRLQTILSDFYAPGDGKAIFLKIL